MSKLACERVIGYTGSKLAVLGNEVIFSEGNNVLRVNGDTGIVTSQSDQGKPLGQVLFSAKHNIAVTYQCNEEVDLIVCSVPALRPLQRTSNIGHLEVLDMAFSRDGSHFAALCSLPTFRLSLYTVDAGSNKFTQVASYNAAAQQPRTIAFSPFSRDELTSVANSHVLFWRVERSQGQLALSHIEGTTQQRAKVSSVAYTTQNGAVLCGTTGGDLYEFDSATGAGVPWWESPGGVSSSIVHIAISRHHVLTVSHDGLMRFFRHDSHIIERTLSLSTNKVAAVAIDPTFCTMYIGGTDGILQLVKFEGYDKGSIKADTFRELPDTGRVLFDCSGGGIKKAVLLERSAEDVVATIGNDNMLRLHSYNENSLLAKLFCGDAPTSIAGGSGNSAGFVLIGHASAHLRVFDVSKCSAPFLVEQLRLQENECPITAIEICPFGRRFAALAGNVGVFFGGQVNPLHVVGFIPFETPVRALAWADNSSVLVSSDTADVRQIAFPAEVESYKNAATKELPPSLFMTSWRFDLPIDKIFALDTLEDSISVCFACRDKSVRTYSLDLTNQQVDPLKAPMKKSTMNWAPTNKAITKLHVVNNWIVTSSYDGTVELRDLNGKPGDQALASACRHNCLVGGVADVVVASDKKRVISVGEDGLMVVWSLAGQRDLPAKPFAIGAMETVADAKVPEPQEITYIMKAEEERTKVLQTKYEWHRKEVSGKIGTLRDQLQEYKQENTTAAADEKLETQAFMIESQRLEIEEQGRQLMAEKEDEIKWTNLAKDCISDRIKKQCWDSMSQHLKILKGMQEKTKIEVPSYVIQKTTHDDRTLLRKVKFLREVEMLEWSRRPNIETLVDLQATKEEEEAEEGEAAPEPEPEKDLDQDGEAEEAEEPVILLEEESLMSVENLLYNKYATYTKSRSITQMLLLGQEIYVKRIDFNKEVQQQLDRKKTDIARTVERNVKIKQIYKELDMPEVLTVPPVVASEHPERVLEITEEEINVTRSGDNAEGIVGESKKRSEEDDTNERALKIMMDNRLERDERVVVEIKIPAFADEANRESYRPREEWSDEEQRAYKEYEKKVHKRQEEEEKHRRALQAELKEVQKDVDKILADYDTQLQNLFNRKLDTDTQICQMDLQIIKLAQGRVQQDEMAVHYIKLDKVVSAAKEESTKANLLALDAQKELQSKRDKLEELIASEKRKTGDKEIRTQHPFSDNEDYCDMLVKILRKSTKPKKDKQKKEAQERKKKDDGVSPDPFAFIEEEEEDKKRKAAAQPDANEVRMEKPEGLRDDAWRDFLDFRRERMDAERLQKHLTDELSDLQKSHDRLAREARAFQDDTDEKSRIFHEFKRQLVRECYNLDTLHTFKQGKIEVEQEAVVTDYADGILIDKKRIEELNVQIREHGRAKVEKMMEIMQFKKGIRHIEWENQMLRHEVRSLEMEHKHLHTLRATKAMQEFIKGGAENHHDVEREGITKKIEHVKAVMQAKIEEKKQQMQKIRIIIREKEAENDVLAEQVKDANQIVAQRQEIQHLQSTGLDQQRNLKLMKDMRVTRKLEDVARAQQEEMKLLKKEIDRLRERTFPSFAVVSKRVVGNPDEL